MNNYEFKDGLAFAQELDKNDELAHFQERFYKNEGEIYMDGNSLGLANVDAEKAVLEIMQVWKDEEIKIWNVNGGHYFNVSRLIAQRSAPLINCDPSEIVTMGNITSNINQAILTFYHPTKERYKILVDELNFPSDIYAIKSILNVKGYDESALKVVKSRDGRTLEEDDIIAAMSDDVALVWLPSVLYRSAQLLDMEKVTKEATKRGIYIGWSMAHSMGSIDHDFRAIEPDFAVWCTYKYLNGGPGSTAGMFINRKHFNKKAAFNGWFGNKDATQFIMSHEFDQDVDANGWLLGTHSMFSTYPVYGALKIFEDATMPAIRKKSLQITAYLMYLINNKLIKYGYSIGNPIEDERRGGHVSLEHDCAYQIASALRELNVIPDFREPNVVRLAPIALYNTYEEVYHLVEILEKIIVEKKYEKYSTERNIVV